RDRRPWRRGGAHALRREPGPGGQLQDRAAAVGLAGPRVAPDRSPADEQGQDGATILPGAGKPRSGKTCDAAGVAARGAGARPHAARPARDQPRKRAVQVGRAPRRLAPAPRGRARLPASLGPRAHGRAALRRRTRGLASVLPRARAAARRALLAVRAGAPRALDGDEPRLRGRRGGGSHGDPGRDRALRTARGAAVNVGGSAAGAVVDAILWLLRALQWIVIIAALISWVSPDPRNPI